MSPLAKCSYCGEDVDPRHSYRKTVGWEKKSLAESRRGGSDIVLREPKDEWACVGCVQLLQMGMSPNQGSLI